MYKHICAYKESTHFDFCLVKRVQRITVVKVYGVTPLIKIEERGGLYLPSKFQNYNDWRLCDGTLERRLNG